MKGRAGFCLSCIREIETPGDDTAFCLHTKKFVRRGTIYGAAHNLRPLGDAGLASAPNGLRIAQFAQSKTSPTGG